MSHHIYHTDALVLAGDDRGEANKYLTLFTSELGLIRATAQGVRLGKSKLRFALQDFSYVRVDLVRGRDVWRVTSAIFQESFAPVVLSPDSGVVLRNVTRLLIRLLAGEESHPDLFAHVLESFRYLKEKSSEVAASILSAESVIVLRILFHTGYLALREADDMFLTAPLGQALLEEAALRRQEMLRMINASLQETQL